MATASTSTSLFDHSILESSPKLQPLELRNNETCFSDGDLTTEFDSCISTHLQTLATKDKKIREFILVLEAQNRIKSNGNFPQR